MSEEKTPVADAEKPQSPAVVKSATTTTAKPKRKPAPENHKENTPDTPGKSDKENPENDENDAPENQSGKSGKSKAAPKRGFMDDVFDVFGWGD